MSVRRKDPITRVVDDDRRRVTRTDLAFRKARAFSMLLLCWNIPRPLSRLCRQEGGRGGSGGGGGGGGSGGRSGVWRAHQALAAHHLQQVQQSGAVPEVVEQVQDHAGRPPLSSQTRQNPQLLLCF